MKLLAALLMLSLPACAGYSGYRLFTLDHTKAGTVDSTNFTVLLSGTYLEFRTAANGGGVQNTVTCGVNSITCPADMVFTSDPLCQTLLSWEFESYTAATGQMIVWVKVPTLSASTNTLIYACVGNTAVTTFQGGATGSAYDSNSAAVYHFAANAKDSSSAGNNLTLSNSPPTVTGEIGQAISFNGTNQLAEASGFSWTGSGPVTVSFWNYVTSAPAQSAFAFTVGNSASTDTHRFAASAPWSDSYLDWDYGGISTGGGGRVAANYSGHLGAWTEITLVSTGAANTYQAIYLNGSLAASYAGSSASTVTGDLIIGAYPYASQYGTPYEDGYIDEFRISNVVRSASWILAEYNNQSSPATFASVSSFVASYTGYRLFTVDHTKAGTANSTNFTVLLSGIFPEFATVANNGKVQNTVTCGVNSITCPADLVFASDSLCKSPYSGWEFESYSSTTGQMIAWVLVPTLSVTSNTLIYACVGNSAVTAFQGGATGAAFDSSTKVVYHFPNATTLTANDSSSGGNNGTLNNSPVAVAGKIGGAASFNGVNQTIESSGFSWTGSSAITVSFWTYVTSAQVQTSFAFTIGDSSSTDAHRCSGSAPWTSGAIIWDYGINTIGTGRVYTSYTNYLGAWTEVTMVSTGSAGTLQAIYLNGAVAVSSASSVSSTVTGDLIVGGYPYASQYGPPYENGYIDEFRVANTVRSASWITAEYNNQSSPSTFATVGTFVLTNAITTQQGFVL